MMEHHWLKFYNEKVSHNIDPDTYPSVSALLENAMSSYKERVAFVSFGEELSFEDINILSRNFAAYLQNEIGVSKGDRVAVMLPNIFAFPIAFIALARIGAIQVNVNPLYTAKELCHQLVDSGAEVIIIYSGSTPTLAKIVEDTPIATIITVSLGDGGGRNIPSPPIDDRIKVRESFSSALQKGSRLTLASVDISGDDTLFLQYTGGTTGLSKGAVLSNRNLIAVTEQNKMMSYNSFQGDNECIITALPMYHVFALAVNLITYFSVGAKNILIANPQDMTGFLAAIMDQNVTAITGVNTLYLGMMAHPDFDKVDWSHLKQTVGGGAPVFASTAKRWKQKTGITITEGYGLSETASSLTVNDSGDEFTQTVGMPVPSTDVILLDDDDNRVAIGGSGEICVKGPQVMSGYWNRPDANAQEFTQDGYLRTGDIGVFSPQGLLKIVDRKKNMILVSGFNVFPTEIESVVSEYPGVVEVACIGIPDMKTGEAVKAFIVCDPSVEIDIEALRLCCKQTLAGYKVPKHVQFMDALPKSNVGKILHRKLREI